MGEELAVIAPPTPPPAPVQTATPPEEADPPPEATPGAKPSRAESVAAILRAQRGLGVQVAEEAAKGEEPPSDEAAKPSDEKPPAETPSGFDSFASIEDESDWTPEKIQQAAAYLQERSQKLVGHFKAGDRRKAKAAEQIKAIEAERESIAKARSDLKPFVEAVNKLRLGTQDERLQALSTLTGLPASTALEVLATGVTDEMDHAASREGQLEAKLAELERKQREREQREQQHQQLMADLRVVRQGIEYAITEADDWPLLKEAAKGREQETVQQLTNHIWKAYQDGKVLTPKELCNSLEFDLMRKQRVSGPREVSKTPSPESGATRRTQQAAAETTTVDHRKKGLHTSEAEKLEGVAAVLRRMRER